MRCRTGVVAFSVAIGLALSLGKSISVLSIKGTDVMVIDTVAMGDEVSQVVFTPTASARWRPIRRGSDSANVDLMLV